MNRRLSAAFILLCLASAGASAQQNTARVPSISVQGEGHVDTAPDHAKLTAEVVTRGKTLEAATATHRQRATKADGILRGMENDGLKIEHATFRLDQTLQPTPHGQKQPEPEYEAVTSFALKTDRVASIDQLVTAIADSGLFEVQNLRFGIEEKNPAVAAARRDAVVDARERAKTYAEAAGLQLGEVLEMSDNSARPMRDMAAPQAMRASMKVSPPATLAVTATINMTWRIIPAP